ncbi:hypothetical protein B0A69_02545 [Chryseobacterium shigense]|uniref:Lipoprotein n=1 Tax=Chryseobacterium shigense TaxID=297244 RepID=A0A1N7I8M3_9FLAO|nr:hypothetical protein [Chryseobacterium shigense]PQA96956.1 hypothetical protein B0A69_02545 [Chryseobacterium shigense]SIS33418.1 hypothetical protein SAMN05421639_102623 [Chryseobacterium shigense]
MKIIFKISAFLLVCLSLCSCPGGNFNKYFQVGSDKENNSEYDKIVNNSETIQVKVGIVDNFTGDKKIYLIVRFKEPKNADFNIISTQYGILRPDQENPQVFRTEIKSYKKKDTVILSKDRQKYYFTR